MNTRIYSRALCIVAIIFGLGPVGCSKPPEKPAVAPAAPPEQVYTVRGRIEALPAGDKPGSSLRIEHEPIDNFVRQDGTMGMDSMSMPFPLAQGVALEGFAKGDIIEFTFEVRWKSQPHMQLTKIMKAPAGTELHLGKASPAK